jgi:hypothetical protein
VIWNNAQKPRGENKDYRILLQEIENKANTIAELKNTVTSTKMTIRLFSLSSKRIASRKKKKDESTTSIGLLISI